MGPRTVGPPTMGQTGFLAVVRRELDWLRRDSVAIAIVLVVPLLAIAVLSLTFSNAVIRNLRVDVVDQDQTRTSLIYVQALNSTPSVSVTQRSTDLNGAMHAVRSGEAIAAVYIPRNLERDITGGNNGAYSAAPGWDACTGLGSPDGQRLLHALSGKVGP